MKQGPKVRTANPVRTHESSEEKPSKKASEKASQAALKEAEGDKSGRKPQPDNSQHGHTHTEL